MGAAEAKFSAFVAHGPCNGLQGASVRPCALCCLLRVALTRSSFQLVSCLRGLNTSDVSTYSQKLPSGELEWSPVVDGVILTDFPANLAQAGHVAKVPVLLGERPMPSAQTSRLSAITAGTNRDEGTLFTKASKDVNATGYEQYLLNYFGDAIGQEIYAKYPPSAYPSPWWAATHAFGDRCAVSTSSVASSAPLTCCFSICQLLQPNVVSSSPLCSLAHCCRRTCTLRSVVGRLID